MINETHCIDSIFWNTPSTIIKLIHIDVEQMIYETNFLTLSYQFGVLFYYLYRAHLLHFKLLQSFHSYLIPGTWSHWNSHIVLIYTLQSALCSVHRHITQQRIIDDSSIKQKCNLMLIYVFIHISTDNNSKITACSCPRSQLIVIGSECMHTMRNT